jgi:hypothetical protein
VEIFRHVVACSGIEWGQVGLSRKFCWRGHVTDAFPDGLLCSFWAVCRCLAQARAMGTQVAWGSCLLQKQEFLGFSLGERAGNLSKFVDNSISGSSHA